MENISQGQEVFGSDGRISTVLLVHNILLDRECYRVRFSDDSSIICDANHLWSLTDEYDYRYPKQVVLTTRQILESPKHGNRNRFVLPVAWPLRLKERLLPIHPYLFGLWLGDGNSYSGQMTAHVDDAAEYFVVFGCHWRKYPSKTQRLRSESRLASAVSTTAIRPASCRP